MTEPASFQFLSPAWLLLLPPLWWLVFLLARYNRRQSMWSRICDRHLLDNMRVHHSAARLRRQLVLPLAIVLTLLVLAAAGPGWRHQQTPLMESASARIIVFDLSQSMRVEDVRPSRFAQALSAVRRVIDADFDGETGLVAYAGAAFVVSPLSRDSNTLRSFVDALEPGLLPLDGTRLDLAIERAQDLLLASLSGRGQIIVVTSGTAQRSRTLQAARTAHSRGHRVSILAVGTAAGGPLIDADGALVKDGGGHFVMARTDFDSLEAIAKAGGGVMFRLEKTGRHDELLVSQITADNLIEASPVNSSDYRTIANEGYWLIWLMLPLALLLFRRNLLWIMLYTVLLPLAEDAAAAEAASIWQHRERQAYDAYRRGEFERSAALSQAPLLKGSAFYRRGLYQKAIDVFTSADSATAHFNRGNSLVQLNRLPEAIVAYEQALALNPALDDARYNKRLLEIFQQRQQGDANSPADDDPVAGGLEPPEQPDNEGRPGVIGEQTLNPGDQQQLESGLGASVQLGQLDPFEQFDGRDQQLERFSLGEGIDASRAELLVKNWAIKLPATSSELFRRKFLRDFERQQQQR